MALSPRLILASSSPRRRQLLKRFNIPFEVIESGLREDVPPHLSPQRLVVRLSQLKARAVADMHEKPNQPTLILGADTTIDLDGSVLGKPQDAEDARRMLSQLRGRSHQVITGVCLILLPANRTLAGAVSTTVRMKEFTKPQRDSYVQSGEPMGKAGSYAIQGLGGELVESISGCYRNVVGLPLCEVRRMLEELLGRPLASKAVCDLPSGEPCPREKRGTSGKAAKPQRVRKGEKS